MAELKPRGLPLVGRKTEQAELAHARDSGRPELIAVYGRRRIGKTYLIRSFFADSIAFELSGSREASAHLQLGNFARELGTRTKFEHRIPDSWPAAFAELIRFLEQRATDRSGRTVVFFDELPWLASPRSGFLPAFEHFWNTWASRQAAVIVVICGSAASWMIAKVLHERGGLHNRVTRSLRLEPFRLREVEAFLRSRGVELTRPQILELAMATGGCPYYLDQVRKGRSAAQNIDSMFFARGAPLRDEFDRLFAALFEHHERHLQVIAVLARRKSGYSRNELLKLTRFPSGGNLSTILSELEASGFICRMTAFGRTVRDSVYRLIDEFTLFHLRWLEGRHALPEGEGRWMAVRGTPAWNAWSGYSFENLCLRHVAEIKAGLGIAGVQTSESTWRHAGGEDRGSGAQIDLLIDRRDATINVCEMKFSEAAFEIDKGYVAELQNKVAVFRAQTRTSKALFLTMVTSSGVAANKWKQEVVQAEITADALFGGQALLGGRL